MKKYRRAKPQPSRGSLEESARSVKRISVASPMEISFEVAVQPESGGKSVYPTDSTPTVANLDRYRVPIDKMVETGRRLQRQGIAVYHISEFSISASCPVKQFESFFDTKLVKKPMPKGRHLALRDSYLAPKERVKPPSVEGLASLVERVYVQPPPVFFADERPTPPFWNDKFRLRVPVDVAQIMRASSAHERGITGKGVRVAMPDTGFYHHPYFVEQGYNFLGVAAPDVTDYTSDSYGHGTGECANLFSTAPGINFVGVKMGNPTLAFKTATDLRPHVMTNSWGYSVDMPNTGMPNWIKPLWLAVLDAVARGITVCFSAGNGHYGFPGSMPEVISVGGVIVTEALAYSATQYTSGFDSTWFPGRRTPDVCGLCGELPTADYIVLPVQKGAALEKVIAGQRGWGAFSGTSACSPMVAGVCALLKQVDPSLMPEQIKSILQYTARDILVGTNAHGKVAGPGPDGATGFGLVDGARAVEVLV